MWKITDMNLFLEQLNYNNNKEWYIEGLLMESVFTMLKVSNYFPSNNDNCSKLFWHLDAFHCAVISLDPKEEEAVTNSHFCRVTVPNTRRWKEGVQGPCGVKLQEQLVYSGMLARMLTLSFTSHLLSCDQQLPVYISSAAPRLYFLHSALPRTILALYFFLRFYFFTVTLTGEFWGWNAWSFLIGANSLLCTILSSCDDVQLQGGNC